MSKLSMLVLESDTEFEKLNGNFIPINIQAHNVIELFMHYLPSIELDGASKLTIKFEKKPDDALQYYYSDYFHISWYYVDDEVLQKSRVLQPEEKNDFYLSVIEDVLCKIVMNSSKNHEIVRVIENTANEVRNAGYQLETKISKLSRCSSDKKYKATLFRRIDTYGEFSYVDIFEKKKKIIHVQVTPQDNIQMKARLHHSEWNGHVFYLYDDLDKMVASIDVEHDKAWTMYDIR